MTLMKQTGLNLALWFLALADFSVRKIALYVKANECVSKVNSHRRIYSDGHYF